MGPVAAGEWSSLRRWFWRFVRDDSGQATLEYILILSATVVGAAAISRSIITAVDRGILNLGAQLEKDLRTGRIPVNVWKN
jgi:Flp pilus assembly pilin Flp